MKLLTEPLSNYFTIIPADNFIWNHSELLKFLIDNQSKDIEIDINSEGCCLISIGLYKILDLFKFKSVIIYTTNILVEPHPMHKIVIINALSRFFKIQENYDEYHRWNKKYIFGALYNRPLWHRIGLSSYLTKYHSNISLVNFRSDPHDQDQRQLFEMQKLFEIDIKSANNFLNVKDCFPLQVELTDGYTVGGTTKQHTDQLKNFYTDFLIDIVAETFTSGRSFFPTEKTVRPMLLKKPFIVMGPKCFLIYLRQLGFKTFNDFWSEDYDGYSPHLKYQYILNLVDSIANKSTEELYKMYQDMHPILNHNYNLLVHQSYNKKIEYVE
jgi:hypothetical protein